MHYHITPSTGSSEYLKRTIATVRESLRNTPYKIVIVAPEKLQIEGVGDLRHLIDAGDGIYPALNLGLDYISRQGDCLSFGYINDDDGLFPQYSSMLREHIRSKADVTYGDVEFIDAGGRYCGNASISRFPDDLLSLFQCGICGLTQQGAIYSKRLLEEELRFNSAMKIAADSLHFVQALTKGLKFSYFPETVAFYRRREGQLSSNLIQACKEAEEVTEYARLTNQGLLRRMKARIRFRVSNAMNLAVRWKVSGVQSSRSFFNGST